MKSKKVTKAKPKQKRTKKIKQKQIVKQNVRVNVQSSGGSGSGGSSIPTIPQYTPPQYIPSVPAYFQDRRGEDVILQKLSEVVDKFNSKPEPVQELPKPNPQPTEYIDGPEDAETQITNSNPILNPRPDTNNNSIQKQIEDAKKEAFQSLLGFNERLVNLERSASSQGVKQNKKSKSIGQPIINIPHDYQASAKKGWETRRQKAEEAKQARIKAIWAEDETPEEAMLTKKYDEKAVKFYQEKLAKKYNAQNAVKRLKEYADNLNSDITYQGLKRDYEEDKKKSAESFKAPSPVQEKIAKIEANLEETSKASPVSKRTRSKANK